MKSFSIQVNDSEDEDFPKLGLKSKKTAIHLALLQNIPFIFTFYDRVALFRNLVIQDRSQRDMSVRGGYSFSARHVKVRRGHIFEDGFVQMWHMRSRLQSNIQIEFIDEYGMPELGIDGGGLFKEFLNE